jgi:hypothetical protein
VKTCVLQQGTARDTIIGLVVHADDDILALEGANGRILSFLVPPSLVRAALGEHVADRMAADQSGLQLDPPPFTA